jgi:regulator of protease activity HflC (stomatin/prohibitin superfamily)
MQEGHAGPICSLIVVFLFWFVILPSSVRILKEHERGVVLRLGRLSFLRGPGIRFVWPLIDRLIRVDCREQRTELPADTMITSDGRTVSVTAAVSFQVVDPNKAVIGVVDYKKAVMSAAKSELARAVAETSYADVLARTAILQSVQQAVGQKAESWGVEVNSVEITNVTVVQHGVRDPGQC